MTYVTQEDRDENAKVYARFDETFKHVSAWTLHFDGQYVGRLAIKHGFSGMGSATAFLQFYSGPMVSARVVGCGFDRTTAAVFKALEKLSHKRRQMDLDAEKIMSACITRCFPENGQRWDRGFEAAGVKAFHVFG